MRINLVLGVGLASFVAACVGEGESEIGSVSSAERAATVYHFMQDGIEVGASSSREHSGFHISVAEGNGSAGRVASVNFSITDVDPTSEVCEQVCPTRDPMCCTMVRDPECNEVRCSYSRSFFGYGWGPIDPADFTVSPARDRARLNTTFSAAAGFYLEHCTIDTAAGTYDCVRGDELGSADVTFTSNGLWSSQSNGTWSLRVGKYATRTQGNSSSEGADCSGTLLGRAIAVTATTYRDGGWISEGRNISRDVVVVPPGS